MNLAGVRYCLAECTVHSLSHCYGLLTALVLLTVLPDGVIQQIFSQKCCHFTCLCAWASEGIFPGGTQVDFPKVFLRGPKSGEICFLALEIKKTVFFAEIFKFLPLFRHPYACV